MRDFDYIIAGAGAAGLSLAYRLGQTRLAGQRVLLIDQDAKTRNDRTWCFWEQGEDVFEPVVFRSWDHLWLHDQRHSTRLAIAPYRYKMIQGLDFYRFVHDWLAAQPAITQLCGTVERIDDHPDGVEVWVDGRAYRGRWAFSSIYQPPPRQPGYAYWLQHFKGWVITTPMPVFDPAAATFMDFRVEQANDVRFVYVLPYDQRTALVEYTLFSPRLEAQEFYDRGLRRYIGEQLGLTSYAVQHVEFGVIPMSDAPISERPSPHVIRIGTAGGMSKASTGYTFQRTQRQTRQIVESLLSSGLPGSPRPRYSRHALMDSVLLNVLDNQRQDGSTVFSQLFRRNDPQRVLRFLDEETTLAEDLALMSTVNIPAFMAASVDVVSRRVRGFYSPWRHGDHRETLSF